MNIKTYLPKLLRSILSRNPLQYLRTTGMFLVKVRDVVDSIFDDDVHAFFFGVVGCDFGRGEGFLVC